MRRNVNQLPLVSARFPVSPCSYPPLFSSIYKIIATLADVKLVSHCPFLVLICISLTTNDLSIFLSTYRPRAYLLWGNMGSRPLTIFNLTLSCRCRAVLDFRALALIGNRLSRSFSHSLGCPFTFFIESSDAQVF